MNHYKNLLVVGGNGNLGKVIVSTFRETWKVVSLDLKPNTQAHHNILLEKQINLEDRIPQICKELEGFSKQYDSILCVAGGWIGGSVKEQEIFSQLKYMHEVQVIPSVLSGHLASKFLSPKGLLMFTGAAVPFKQTAPDMLAYTLTKTSVHSLALNLAERKEIPPESTVVTILPETIDTPDNRKAMPNADFNKWTPPEKIAELLKNWSEGTNRPKNGSFVVLKTRDRDLTTELV